MLNKEGDFKELELDYTESKWENTIDRKSGTAGNPRQIERVPAEAIFSFEIVYDIYDDKKNNKFKKEIHLEEIKKALRLLQDDYLGGSGSRGYGKIVFENLSAVEKTIKNYEEGNKGTNVEFKLN
jgi:CRISPR-associated protein Csm3